MDDSPEWERETRSLTVGSPECHRPSRQIACGFPLDVAGQVDDFVSHHEMNKDRPGQSNTQLGLALPKMFG